MKIKSLQNSRNFNHNAKTMPLKSLRWKKNSASTGKPPLLLLPSFRSRSTSNEILSEISTMFFSLFAVSYFRLVEQTLQPLEAKRRAFRLVGGVLVERTVGEVLPSVISNRENVSHRIIPVSHICLKTIISHASPLGFTLNLKFLDRIASHWVVYCFSLRV